MGQGSKVQDFGHGSSIQKEIVSGERRPGVRNHISQSCLVFDGTFDKSWNPHHSGSACLVESSRPNAPRVLRAIDPVVNGPQGI